MSNPLAPIAGGRTREQAMVTAVQRRSHRMPRNRPSWVAGAALVVALGLLIGRWRHGGGAKSEVRYETATVSRGDLLAKVTATGTLSAVVTVQVGSQVSGRIAEILVDFNSPVTEGEVLARIDPLLFQAAVDQARANDGAAKANVARAESDWRNARTKAERSRVLRSRNLISQEEADNAVALEEMTRAQVVATRATLDQTAAALHQAEVNLDYATIRSPINGIVLSRNVDVGQTVAASFQAPVLFVLAEDLRRMQVDSSVAEADVGRLTPGMETSFMVDAFPARAFEGVVRQIRNAATTVQNVVTYDAVIDVENPDLLLKPGMTANITFVYARRDQVLRIPNAALRFRPPQDWGALENSKAGAPRGDRRTVWVVDEAGRSPREIRIGVTDGSQTELVEGELSEGDALVTEALGPKKTGPGSFGRVL